MDRALRRHHMQRLKAKRRNYHSWSHDDEEITPRLAGMFYHTPQLCSCCGCGNPRKHFGEKSIQERREEQA